MQCNGDSESWSYCSSPSCFFSPVFIVVEKPSSGGCVQHVGNFKNSNTALQLGERKDRGEHAEVPYEKESHDPFSAQRFLPDCLKR